MSSITPQSDEAVKLVTIIVNGTDVRMSDHKATGAQITTAAIAAGVPIQADFILYERRGDSQEYVKVEPNQTITLHDGEVFRAVAPDDVA